MLLHFFHPFVQFADLAIDVELDLAEHFAAFAVLLRVRQAQPLRLVLVPFVLVFSAVKLLLLLLKECTLLAHAIFTRKIHFLVIVAHDLRNLVLSGGLFLAEVAEHSFDSLDLAFKF